jgi:hypothetical protein
MSVAAAVLRPTTLGDLVRRSLHAACADAAVCVWCGSSSVTVARSHQWGGEVTVSCHDCGCQLSGPSPLEQVESA